jgi:hypothetical protein
VTDIEDVDDILADGGDDSVLVYPLAASAVERLADLLGELSAVGSITMRSVRPPGVG